MPVLVSCRDSTSTEPGRVQLWGSGSWYLLGVNYPWLHYGHDFGETAWGHDGASATATKDQIDSDFAYLKSHGVHVVRWFLFADCRAAPEFDANGLATGYDEHFYADVDAALTIAEKHGVCLILTLLDFHLCDKAKVEGGVQLGGRASVITDSSKRQAFLDNALMPLLRRYGERKCIIAWDVMNEPEGAMDIAGGRWVEEPVPPDAMRAFVDEVVRHIHTYSSQLATVGAASRGMLSNWTGSNLDFYQFHYYDHMAGQYPLDCPYASLGLDKPCIVGEFPTKNTERTITDYLDTIFENGYAGALAWSLRASDDSSDFKAVSAEFAAWAAAHEQHVRIEFKAK